jgi:hypothetical protein
MQKDLRSQRWIVRLDDLPKVVELIGRGGKRLYYKLIPARKGFGLSLNGVERKLIDDLDGRRTS